MLRNALLPFNLSPILRLAPTTNTHHDLSGSLSKEERLDYVNAVKCLQELPPRTPASVAAGAKSRVRFII